MTRQSSHPHGITLDHKTINSLQDMGWVSDVVIDYRIIGLLTRHQAAFEKGDTTARLWSFFASFYQKLTERTEDDLELRGRSEDEFHKVVFDKVKNYTKGVVDIFVYDYIFVPICSGGHWSLAIICHPGAHRSFCAFHRSQMMPGLTPGDR